MHGNLLPLVSTGITVCLALESLFGAQAAKPVFVQGADGRIAPGTATVFPGKNPAGNVSAQSAKVSVPTQPGAPVVPRYPLRRSANNRYFIDQNDVPFMVIGDSPQSLGSLLNTAQQTTYFSNRQTKGFNAVWINVLCGSHFGCGDEGTAGGVAPFTSGSDPLTYDLATPNNSYFALYDATVNLAASYGLTVFLDPIETIDWLVTLENNGSTKAFNYGAYIGNRYRDFPNIVWVHGNDFGAYTNPADNNLVGQVMAGIASVDGNHLQTINLLSNDFVNDSDCYSNQDTALSAYYGADLAYTLSATANVTLNAYNSSPTIPVFLGESNYEFENYLGYVGGVTGAYRLRAEAYGSLTWGGIGGYLYGNLFTWRSTWTSDPANLLDTPGAAQIAHINTLMAQVGAWWNLIPDQTHAVVTAGYGSVPGNNTDPTLANYCTTSANSSVSLTYCPQNSTLTVAMSNFSSPVTARWFDPSNGTFTAIAGSPFPNSGNQDYTMPGNNADGNPDWLLLLQVPDSQPPAISYTPLENTTSNAAVPLDVTVTDNVAVGSVSIYYAVNGGTFTSSPCPMGAMSTFNCSIPGQQTSSAVAYYVGATDTSGNTTTNTSASEPNLYSVGAAAIPTGTYSSISFFDGSTLGGNVTVNGIVTLDGIVTTGANTLSLGCSATVEGGGTSNYVIGNIEKQNCATGTFIFPLGTPPIVTFTGYSTLVTGDYSTLLGGGFSSLVTSGYSPLVANITAIGTNPSSLLVTVDTGTAPATPPLGATTLQRYWTITETGDLTVNLLFNYLDGDIPPGANEQTYQLTKIEGVTATRFPPPTATVNPMANTASINGVMNFSKWTLAAPLEPTNTTANVAGHVLDNSGTPLSGVTLSLLDTVLVEYRTTISDASGAYFFDAILTGRQILVTPSRNGYTFSPQNRVFNHTANVVNIDFTGTPDSSESRSVINDFDGDGKTDLSIFRPLNATWYVLLSSTGVLKAEEWGLGSDRIVPADYDGDRITDLAVFRPSTGTWYIHQSSTQTIRSVNWGLAGDVVMPADYDGDAQADIAVWRPSTGTWYIIQSTNGQPRTINWGTTGDRPVAADYDGDKKADIAVWRPLTGTWFIIRSSDGTYQNERWGIEEDRPAAGDYDGDGMSDLALFRPSTATWYVKLSSDASTDSRAQGTAADILTPGDYDGDGKTDRAVWQLGGEWSILHSSTNSVRNQHWGTIGDIPTPSAFVR